MKAYSVSDIAGTLKYGKYQPKILCVLAVLFAVLTALLIISFVLFLIIYMHRATQEELTDFRIGLIIFPVLTAVCAAGSLALYFSLKRQKAFVQKILSAPDLKESAVKPFNIGEEFLGSVKLMVRFRADGINYEKRSKRYTPFFRTCATYRKLPILYSPSLDEVLFLKF